MTRIQVGYTRVYLSPQCEVRGGDRLTLLLPVGPARVQINIGKYVLPIWTLSLGPAIPKRRKRADEAKQNAGPVEQYPPQSKLGAKCYTELIALVSVDIDEGLASAFREKNPDARAQVMKVAHEQEAACMAALDVAAAAVGLYIHPRLVSDRIVERVVAFRGGSSSSYAFSITSPNIRVVEPVTLRLRDGARLQKRMRAPKDPGRAERVAPWLLRAWGAADDPVNEFVSLFVPFEVNLEEEQPPKKWSKQRDAVFELIDKHGGKRRDKLREFLEPVLKYPPLMKRFRQQAGRSGLKDWKKDVGAGYRFNAKRNDLLHRGDTRILKPVKVGAAQVRTVAELVHRYVGKTIFGSAPRRRTKQHKGPK